MSDSKTPWPERLHRLGELDTQIIATAHKVGLSPDPPVRGFDGDSWLWIWTGYPDDSTVEEVQLRARLTPMTPHLRGPTSERIEIQVVAQARSRVDDELAWSRHPHRTIIDPGQSPGDVSDWLITILDQTRQEAREAVKSLSTLRAYRDHARTLLDV